MLNVINFKEPYWISYVLTDGKMRWFYTDEKSAIRIPKKEWFNKSTTHIIIHKGYETNSHGTEPISKMIYRVSINYKIANYFGDRSGMHYRSKNYMLIGDELYKQENGEGVLIKRITKELKGVLEELKNKWLNKED